MSRSRTKRARGAEGLWPARLGVFSLRVFTGAVFLDAFEYKVLSHGKPLGATLADFVRHDYRPTLEAAVADPPRLFGAPLEAYATFLDRVMLHEGTLSVPHLMAPVILFFELLLGLSLVLGAGVRLSATLGAVMMAGFGLAHRTWFLTASRGTHWILAVVLLALALVAAGRVWGLDARWVRRLPRWVS